MAIAFDAFTSPAGGEAQTNYTFSHTCTGSNRILFVAVIGATSSDNITGVTYNGVSLTLVDKQTTSAVGGIDREQYLFVLQGPASGSNTVAVASSPAGSVYPVAASYTGAHQTNAIVGAKGQNNSTTSLSVGVTTVAANSWVAAGTRLNAGTMTASTNTVSRGTDSQYVDSGSGPGAAGLYTMTVTASPATAVGMILAAFEPVGAGGGATWGPSISDKWCRIVQR